MKFTNAKINGIEKDFKSLESIMKKAGFIRWTWDFHKVTYDKKYTLADIDYYLRVSGRVINEREIEHPKALVKLENPVFARHFFPHGLDDEAKIPSELEDQVKHLLKTLDTLLT